ncbi:MAG: hypothetical protein WCH11_02090 [Bdellovibrio sp.]
MSSLSSPFAAYVLHTPPRALDDSSDLIPLNRPFRGATQKGSLPHLKSIGIVSSAKEAQIAGFIPTPLVPGLDVIDHQQMSRLAASAGLGISPLAARIS